MAIKHSTPADIIYDCNIILGHNSMKYEDDKFTIIRRWYVPMMLSIHIGKEPTLVFCAYIDKDTNNVREVTVFKYGMWVSKLHELASEIFNQPNPNFEPIDDSYLWEED